MKKILLLAATLALVACGGTTEVKQVDEGAAQSAAATPATVVVEATPAPNVAKTESSAIKEYVQSNSVAKHLNYLASDELGGRDTGSEGIEKAAAYITDLFKKAGVQPYFDTYRDNFEVQGLEAFNLLGVVPGTDPRLKDEYILIGAHYDHIGTAKAVNGDTIANGANDNASGTVSVIELAQHFAKAKTNKRSLIFALFSAEEKGLSGSAHLAQRLKRENLNLYTMFNIEMVGVPMTGKDYLVYLTGYENSNMAEKFNDYVGKKVIGFLPQAKEYNLFKRSDNYPFYEVFKLPAQTVSTFDFTNFEYYHQVDDEVQFMDTEHMAKVINNLIPGVEGMANAASQEIKWSGE